MGAVKKLYTASRQYDRETGASLCARPGSVRSDYERGASWEDDVREALRTHTTAGQSRDVQVRLQRGRRLFRQGRRGIVKEEGGGRFSFQVQTTEEFRRNRWPLDDVDGYHGYIVVEDDQLTDGHCDCPDEGEEWRGFLLCKHMVWAMYRVREGSYELNTHVELWLEHDWDKECTVVARVMEKGSFRKPRPGETLNRKRKELLGKGYVHARTAFFPRDINNKKIGPRDRPFWVIEVFVQYANDRSCPAN